MDGTRRFQSTHPRGVRLIASCERSVHLDVSIHAPARGATREHVRQIHRHEVSIHAPARGATAGGRGQVFGLHVSIHAPARGATPSSCHLLHRHSCFNPRTREGCDSAPVRLPQPPREFQSTHPRGVRPYRFFSQRIMREFQSTHPRGVRRESRRRQPGSKSFNPRTREGCDVWWGRL